MDQVTTKQEERVLNYIISIYNTSAFNKVFNTKSRNNIFQPDYFQFEIDPETCVLR